MITISVAQRKKTIMNSTKKNFLLFLTITFHTFSYTSEQTLLNEQPVECTTQQTEAEQQKGPLLVVVLMVKNEGHVMAATLEPFIKTGINSFFIFDTGSTDDTIEVTQNYFNDQNITDAYIAQEPFIDFAASRNRALELAEAQFPTATFFVMPDAEWYLENGRELVEFCKAECNECTRNAYLFTLQQNCSRFQQARLIRAHTNTRFGGEIHEAIICNPNNKVPSTTYFRVCATAKGYEKSKQRWQRDLKILLKKFNECPYDSRSTFYLAQTYECLGDYQNAFKYYTIRSQQLGFDEENYEVFCRLGRVTEYLSTIDENFTWHMAFDYYIRAFNLRPHRAEPLIKIAAHYWPNNVPLCYLFARRALDLPYPENDTLFVDSSVYEFERYEILSKSAWHVNEFEMGKYATLNALKVHPDMPHLHNNLACYVTRLQQEN